jgi:hypothetical protein
LRDLAASRAAAGDGLVAHVGAGVKYWSARRTGGLRYGVRVEGRLSARWRGLTLDDEQVHLAPALTVGLLLGS